jgi:PQQ-like domain
MSRRGAWPFLFAVVACHQTGIGISPTDTGVVADSPPPRTDAPVPFGPASVLTGHLHATRDGAYVDSTVTQSAASSLTLATGFNATYDGQMYAQPLYVDGFRPGQDAVFVTTASNVVAAFDAVTGATLWTKSLGAPVSPSVLPCKQPSADLYGVLSTPVIDEGSRTIFLETFVSTGDDGAIQQHLVWGLSIDDGSVRPGWPVDIATKVDGFTAIVQHQRGSILLFNGTVYLPFSGIEYDCITPTPYHGRVVGISISDPSQVTEWHTTAIRGGIWGAVSTDGTNIFFATGNTYQLNEPAEAGTPWAGGEAVIRLTPNLTFAGDTTSYFAPSTWLTMDVGDNDLGSSSLMLVDLPGSTPSTLAVAGGKAGVIHLVDRNNLGGIGTGTGQQGEGLFSQYLAETHYGFKGNPAAYTTTEGQYLVFRADAPVMGCPSGMSGDLIALKLVVGAPPTYDVAWCADAPGLGSPMVTTTDGENQPVVWVTTAQGSNTLLGFDGDTGAPLFTGGGVTMSYILRWTSPIVAKGRFFVGATGQLFAFDAP